MSSRRAPRGAGEAIRAIREETAPATLLAAVQGVWADALGEGIAAEAEPVAEREGVIAVACRTAAWAQELDLLQEQLVARLNAALPAERVAGLRFTADAARHRPPGDLR